jgi:hypothetical protein
MGADEERCADMDGEKHPSPLDLLRAEGAREFPVGAVAHAITAWRSSAVPFFSAPRQGVDD